MDAVRLVCGKYGNGAMYYGKRYWGSPPGQYEYSIVIVTPPRNSKIKSKYKTSKYWGNGLWGASDTATGCSSIHIKIPIAATLQTTIQCSYQIVCRYKITECTIEDMYSYATDRYMRMKCLDGPMFPLYDKEADE